MTHENPTTPPARVLDRSGPDVRLDRGRGGDCGDSSVGEPLGSLDRGPADPGTDCGAFDRRRPPDTAGTYTNGGFAYGYYQPQAHETTGAATGGQPIADALTRTDSTYPATFPASASIVAAGADSIPDAGSDSSSPPTDRPDLRQRGGQRGRDRDDMRNHDRPDFSDSPRVPRRRGSPDGGLHPDDLQRAGDVGGSLQWDRERRWGDLEMFGDGCWLGLGFGDALRRDRSRRDAGRADLHLGGDERRDDFHVQRISQRRRGVGDLSGGLT